MTLDILTRPPSLVEKVSERLAEIVRRDQQEDDGWLPTERELSAQLGVSRSVVREATKRLELQGLVEIQHGIGTRAVDKLHKPLCGALHLLVPDEKQRLRQLCEVRLALEPENARLAAIRSTAAARKALRASHARFEAAVSFDEQVEADMAFHCLLAEASGNRIAALLIQSLSELLQVSLKHGYSRVTKDLAVTHHDKILKAILAHNPAAAAKATHAHLERARADLGL